MYCQPFSFPLTKKLWPLASGICVATGLWMGAGDVAQAWTLDGGAITVTAEDAAADATTWSNSFTVDLNGLYDYGGDQGVQTVEGLGGSAQVQVNPFNYDVGTDQTTVNLNVLLFAGTDGSDLFENYRISVFGFAIDPDLLFDESSVAGTFDTINQGEIKANGGIMTEYCLTDSAKNCNGGNDGGVWLNESGNLSIDLVFAGAITEFTLSDFGVRYQSIDSSYYGFNDESGTGSGTPIPEPASILGSLVGLGFLGSYRKQKRSLAQEEQEKEGAIA